MMVVVGRVVNVPTVTRAAAKGSVFWKAANPTAMAKSVVMTVAAETAECAPSAKHVVPTEPVVGLAYPIATIKSVGTMVVAANVVLARAMRLAVPENALVHRIVTEKCVGQMAAAAPAAVVYRGKNVLRPVLVKPTVVCRNVPVNNVVRTDVAVAVVPVPQG